MMKTRKRIEASLNNDCVTSKFRLIFVVDVIYLVASKTQTMCIGCVFMNCICNLFKNVFQLMINDLSSLVISMVLDICDVWLFPMQDDQVVTFR